MEKISDFNPVASALSRRSLLALSGACLTVSAFVGASKSSAQESASLKSADASEFMQFSRFATGHASLDAGIGSALFLAIQAKNQAFSQQLAALRQRVSDNNYQDVEQLNDALNGDPLRDTLLQVIRGWYSGVIESGTNAKVYAFQEALMYKTSSDVVVIPTYAHNGPNYWVAAPAPVDVMPEF